MPDIAFFVLLAFVFGALAVRQAVGADRTRRTRRLQQEHELSVANALWEVRRREENDQILFSLWRYPGIVDTQEDWRVQLGQKDDVKFMEQHSTVLTAVEAERDRRNFELMEIRRAETQEKRFLKR